MSILRFIIPYEKIEDIPLEEYKHLHKQYWTFIAENRLNYKPEIVGPNGESINVLGMCFACEFAYSTMANAHRHPPTFCLGCPIEAWRNNCGLPFGCLAAHALYTKWRANKNVLFFKLKKKKLALQIANLEWGGV